MLFLTDFVKNMRFFMFGVFLFAVPVEKIFFGGIFHL